MSQHRNKLLYGSGVFTTVAISGQKPFRWASHWRRLSSNAARLGIDLSAFGEESVRQTVESAALEKNISEGKARITFYDERASTLWPSATGNAVTGLDVLIGERRSHPEKLCLAVSPYTVNTRSPLTGVKSCNYLENILTLDEAKGRGSDEAVRINENGHVASAAMANLFWLKGSTLYTPSLATGCLAGTTREYILENLGCHEVKAEIGELETADSIFLTSAGSGVAEAADFESRKLPPSGHPIKNILPWQAKERG